MLPTLSTVQTSFTTHLEYLKSQTTELPVLWLQVRSRAMRHSPIPQTSCYLNRSWATTMPESSLVALVSPRNPMVVSSIAWIWVFQAQQTAQSQISICRVRGILITVG